MCFLTNSTARFNRKTWKKEAYSEVRESESEAGRGGIRMRRLKIWRLAVFPSQCCCVRQSQTGRNSCRVLPSVRGSTRCEGTEASIVRQKTAARHCIMQKWEDCQNQRTFGEVTGDATCYGGKVQQWHWQSTKKPGWKKTATSNCRQGSCKLSEIRETLECNFAW